MPIIDSLYTDPDALRALYRNPKNPLRETETSNTNDPSIIPPPPVPPVIVPPPQHHCPAATEYIAVRMSTPAGGAKMTLVHLVRPMIDYAWDAISNSYSLIMRAEIIPDVECVEVVTFDGASTIVSHSHPIIQHFDDRHGSPVEEFINNPRLSAAAVSVHDFQPRQDAIEKILYAGKHTIVSISLQNGKRYASGTHPSRLVMGHNKAIDTPLETPEA